MKLAPSKQHPTTTTISRLTSIATYYMSVAKSVKETFLSLSRELTLVIGFPTVLAQRMWSYFLKIPFGSSTSSLVRVCQYQHSTIHSSDYTLSEHGRNLKKSTRIFEKYPTRSISLAWTAYQLTGLPLLSSSIGQTTSSNQKPRKRGVVQASSSPASGASSVEPKLSAAPASVSQRCDRPQRSTAT